MAKTPQHPDLFKAKEDVFINLQAIHSLIVRSVDEGMVDLEDTLYNQCLGLLDDVDMVQNWDEMEELIFQGKLLERDVDAWLAIRGQTSVSMAWPKRTQKSERKTQK